MDSLKSTASKWLERYRNRPFYDLDGRRHPPYPTFEPYQSTLPTYTDADRELAARLGDRAAAADSINWGKLSTPKIMCRACKMHNRIASRPEVKNVLIEPVLAATWVVEVDFGDDNTDVAHYCDRHAPGAVEDFEDKGVVVTAFYPLDII